MTTAYLHLAGNKLLISFDYNKYLINEIKKIPGTRWNKALSRWEAPLNLYPRLISILDDVKISNAVMEKLKEEAELKLKVEELRKKEYHELEDYAPKVPLMSHQKKAFELHRLLPGSLNASEMGSGKCQLPETLVYLDGKLNTIESIYHKYAGEEIVDTEGGFWARPKEDIFVYSFNNQGIFVKNRVKNLYKQYIKEKVRIVHLDDGSQIGITRAHKLYSINTWSNELELDKIICVPKQVPHESGELDINVANLFGWMIGDGTESGGSKNRHRFTQKEEDSFNHFLELITNIADKEKILINPKFYVKDIKRTPEISITSKVFRDFCESKGYDWGKLSASKHVPTGVMQAEKKAVAAFLRGFFDAEAYVSDKGIEVSSASQLMIKEVGILLRRFGIWLRTRKKQACASNGSGIYRDYWVGMVGGPSARIFKDEIGFFTKYKQEALEQLCQKEANSNVEGLPAHKLLQEIVSKTGLPIRHIVGNYTIYLKGTQEPTRKTLKKFIDNIDKILDGRKRHELTNLPTKQTYQLLIETYKSNSSYNGTAKALNSVGLLTKKGKPWYSNTVKKIITDGEDFQFKGIYDNLDLNWLRIKRDQLQQLIDQDVHYASIKDIQEIDYEGWVYDLEVEPYHNFVAENILCHNTGSAICSIHWHLEMGNIERALVICPKSVMRGWEEQIEFFSDLSYVTITGIKKEDRLTKLNLNRNIFIINYEYTWRITDILLERGFQMVIADEAHRIKNPQSNQSKACYALADAAQYKIALTGTPVLNSSLDAFGVMRFVDPTVFGESFYAFRSKYFKNVGPENSPIQIFVPKSGADKEISDKMYTRALRFLKDECMDLPTAIHLPNRVVYLSRDQDKAYRNLQEQLSAEITENKSIKINHVLSLMLKLNQITSGWVKDSDTGEIIHFKQNPKFEELIDVVEEAGDQPIIIWAYYRADMKLITDYYGRCQKCKIPVNNIPEDKCPNCHTPIRYRCSEVQGSTKYRNAEIAKFRLTPKERADLRKKFTEEGLTPAEIRAELDDVLPNGDEPPQTNIIVCQITAASEGLNLQRATLAVFYSRNWSLKDWSQALARNHRKGQTKKVTYINLVAKMANGDDTVDQRIVEALSKKEDLSKRVNKDDIKLLMGNFKKKDREAFKDLTVDENSEIILDEETDSPNNQNNNPEQKGLFDA